MTAALVLAALYTVFALAADVQQPVLHLTNAGWLSNPAPAYDSRTQTYHVFFLCNADGSAAQPSVSAGQVVAN